jgi:hypothetical protein
LTSSSPTTAPASSSPSLPTSSSSASYLALVSPTGFAPRPDETEARKAFTTSLLGGGQEVAEKENQTPSSSEDEGDSQVAP